MNIQELYELAGTGEQRRNVEIKRSMSWNDPSIKAKIVKAILAMSNIRDGGFLVLGFEERGDSYLPAGMNEDHLASFDYDEVRSHVAQFADPYVIFFMEPVKDDRTGRKFLVFTINEFEEIPVICKRNGLENLRAGDMYTRSRRMPSTEKLPTQSEMREIIDMAIEKGMRRFIERAQHAGLSIRVEPDEYDRELEGIL